MNFIITFIDPVSYDQIFAFWAAMFMSGLGLGLLLKFVSRLFTTSST